MKRLYSGVFTLILPSLILISCGSDKKQAEKEESIQKPLVAVVNYPLYTFGTMIGGDKVEVFFPQIDGDPAYWQPDNSGIKTFQNADLILLNGADYARWVEKVSLPSSTQVNTSKAFTDRLIEMKGEAHSHGPEGEHSHTGYAFTTWLDLKNALGHAEAVHESLIDLLPEEKELFSTNFKVVKDQLNQLDGQLAQIFDNQEDLEVFASHPVYQYLAKGYGVDIISYHWEPDQMPSELAWKEFEYDLDQHSARVMLWEDEPLAEVKQKLEGLGVKVIIYNPGGNRNALDFVSLMSQNVQNLQTGLN